MASISRHFRDDHIKIDNFETRLATYEDQVRGWFLDQARILNEASSAAGFVVLLVVLTYVEGYAIFSKGEDSKNRSRDFFRDAFKEIFRFSGDDEETIDSAVDDLYDQMRNGMFHTGIVRGKVILSGEFERPVSIEMHRETRKTLSIKVNPALMLFAVEDHFAFYTMRLRDPNENTLRENFERAWKLRQSSIASPL